MSDSGLQNIRVFVAATQMNDIGAVKSALGRLVHSVAPLSLSNREKLQQQTFTPGSMFLIEYSANLDKLQWICEVLRQQAPDAAILMFDHDPQPAQVVKAFLHPIDDFLNFSEDTAVFKARLMTKAREIKQRTQLRQKVQSLEQQVDIDDLSGLLNMRSVYRKIDGEMRRAQRYKRDLSCVMMDIDHFKRVNDTNDHLFGSYCLAEVGKLIAKTVRSGMDLAARYGGDEFLVLLPETGYDGAAGFSERFRTVFANHQFDNHVAHMKLTVSIGYTSFELTEVISAEDLVRRADKALYLAKNRGRNRCEGLTRKSAETAGPTAKLVAGT